MSKEERLQKDLIKALDQNTRATEELIRQMKRDRVTARPSQPPKPEGTAEMRE